MEGNSQWPCVYCSTCWQMIADIKIRISLDISGRIQHHWHFYLRRGLLPFPQPHKQLALFFLRMDVIECIHISQHVIQDRKSSKIINWPRVTPAMSARKSSFEDCMCWPRMSWHLWLSIWTKLCAPLEFPWTCANQEHCCRLQLWQDSRCGCHIWFSVVFGPNFCRWTDAQDLHIYTLIVGAPSDHFPTKLSLYGPLLMPKPSVVAVILPASVLWILT